MHQFSSVLLVDRRGWILMQERDEHPVIDPECWGYPGGHLEEGETPLEGAHREFAEETGVELAEGSVELWRKVGVHHTAYDSDDVMHLFVGATALSDADVECHEGRQIVFVDPAVAAGLPLTAATGLSLPAFLGSSDCVRLIEEAKELS
ncbi:NUDIX domain-containing protein [Nocardioides sp. JQ2195]|uniref:NUDIX domain-containing protein n=1 Tax=Nocardioides sp. JQ2195 TaxID=2592334 RepID=UPI00143E8B04|nr:NUDIX domain-containing protein [Nocardioides sp. JQ2195]QIX26590.1 NUDIX domain-containing protein [Nocardioides sp. JQ2195]